MAEPLHSTSRHRYQGTLLGKTNFMTIDTRSNLGVLYLTHGEYEKAEPLLKQSLEITKAVYGASSLECACSTIWPRSSLPGVTTSGPSALSRVLAIRKKLLGVKNPSYAAVLNDLGALNYSRADYAKAEPFFVEGTISSRRRSERTTRPTRSLHNLAALSRRGASSPAPYRCIARRSPSG